MATPSKDIFEDLTLDSKGDIFDEISLPSPSRKVRQAAKGIAKGTLGTYGDLLDLVGAQSKKTLPGEKKRRKMETDIIEKIQEGKTPSIGELLILGDDEDILPRTSRLPTSKEVGEFVGEEEPKDFLEKVLSKGGEALGSGVALGGNLPALLSLLGGAVAGESARELGAPEGVASGVDIATTLLSGKPSKKLLPKKRQAELVKKLRQKGFTDKEITPLIQSERKLRQVGKIAAKDEKIGERLGEIKGKIGNVFGSVREKGKNLPGLSAEGYIDFEKNLNEVLKDIRPGYKRLLKEELNQLKNTPHDITDLIDFYQDINMKVKGVEGGKAILNKLKPPVLDAIRSISPEAAEDFQLANRLYSKLFQTAKTLKPKNIEDLIGLGELYGLGAGLATGNLGVLSKVGGITGGRILARELLLNPRLQNFSEQIAAQIKKNNPAGVRKITQQMMKYLEKKRPDIFEELEIVE